MSGLMTSSAFTILEVELLSFAAAVSLMGIPKNGETIPIN